MTTNTAEAKPEVRNLKTRDGWTYTEVGDYELWTAESLAKYVAEREAAAHAIPEGMVLVPIEPTEAMWTAGREPVMYRDLKHYRPADESVPAWQIGPTGEVETDTSKGTTAVHVWRAMIEAAPKEAT